MLIDLDNNGTSLNTPAIGIGIDNQLGSRICTVGTYFSKEQLPPINGHVTVLCEIPYPVFVPGSYTMKVAVGRSIYENLDVVNIAAKFDIRRSDYYGNGRLPTNKQGFVVSKSNWQLINQ